MGTTLHVGIACVTLIVAMVLGGSVDHLRTMPVVICSALCLGWSLLHPLPQSPATSAFNVLLAGVALLFLVQLTLLPPAIWLGLPGRDMARLIWQEAGVAAEWHPLSLDPQATASAGLMIILPLAMYRMTALMPRGQVPLLLLAFVLLGAISALVGMVQITTLTLYPYQTAHTGYSTGFFANRNHHADLIQCAMLAGAAYSCTATRTGKSRLAANAGIGLGALLTLTTGSRAGIALLLASVPVAVLLANPQRRFISIAATVCLLAIGLAGAALYSASIGDFVSRFASLPEQDRTVIWRDAMAAAKVYFPVGSGFGTFASAYAAVEDLAFVGNAYIADAHNEYLQLALEGGLPALLLVAGFVAWLACRGFAFWHVGADAMQWAALACIGLLLAHSLVDYPLRNPALLAPLGLFAGLVARQPSSLMNRRPL